MTAAREPITYIGPLPRPGARRRATAADIILATQLRGIREAAGLPAEAAAGVLGLTPTRLRGLEAGRTPLRNSDLSLLVALYGVTDPDVLSGLTALARRAGESGWWQPASGPGGGLSPMAGLEREAAVIRTFHPYVIPDLLQTRAYAEAQLALERPGATPGERHALLEARMRRRHVLHQPDAPTMWAVLAEETLTHPEMDPLVLREQLAHLIEAARSTVALQILPRGTGQRPPTPVTLLRFAPDLPDLAVMEHHAGTAYFDDRMDVEQQQIQMDHLTAAAATTSESTPFLQRVLSRTPAPGA
ncbi:hypothetical protein SRB5_08930 [Streptomyces sp. RB5]|uniref:HTH cro/C1-type domain-containing protein n=1 Tax=Streptomyces smaragdinus TaxID=2585196 RepID=A0A7K0CBE6_9ACTN|nr:DUF5753 domain-containing protein [Streptomyces smaragdinus]MQY10780.1 hypothetical protein [Streptomyces smaragdinus]